MTGFDPKGLSPGEAMSDQLARLLAALDACQKENALLRQASEIEAQRLKAAAQKAGVPYLGCDTPDWLADEILGLRHIQECANTPLMADVLAERDALAAQLGNIRAGLEKIKSYPTKPVNPQLSTSFEMRILAKHLLSTPLPAAVGRVRAMARVVAAARGVWLAYAGTKDQFNEAFGELDAALAALEGTEAKDE